MGKSLIGSARGGPPEGWISKTTPDELGDGISSPKSGPRAYTSPNALAHGRQAAEEEWHVESCSMGFPLTCRSASCASESEVSDRRSVGQKKSLVARRSDGGGSGGGFGKENKVTGRKHDHRKKLRFSLLALIPCEERKGRILNFYYIHVKN